MTRNIHEIVMDLNGTTDRRKRRTLFRELETYPRLFEDVVGLVLSYHGADMATTIAGWWEHERRKVREKIADDFALIVPISRARVLRQLGWVMAQAFPSSHLSRIITALGGNRRISARFILKSARIRHIVAMPPEEYLRRIHRIWDAQEEAAA